MNVIARISPARARPVARREAIRWVSTRVFPEPAPAGEDPTPEDLALRMLKARCATLAHDGALLKADASRILADLAANSRTRRGWRQLWSASPWYQA